MPLDLGAAIAQQRTNLPKIHSGAGAHPGYFIGTGEPFEDYGWNGCKNCGRVAVNAQTGEVMPLEPKTKGPGCNQCQMTGQEPVVKVQLLYCMEDGTQEREVVTYKLSPPRTFGNGRQSRPSKMYERFQAFSGLNDPDEIIKWAAALPEAIEIPVTVIIKQKTNGYLAITEVVGRVVRQEKPVTPRTRRVAVPAPAPADDDEPEDMEIPF